MNEQRKNALFEELGSAVSEEALRSAAAPRSAVKTRRTLTVALACTLLLAAVAVPAGIAARSKQPTPVAPVTSEIDPPGEDEDKPSVSPEDQIKENGHHRDSNPIIVRRTFTVFGRTYEVESGVEHWLGLNRLKVTTYRCLDENLDPIENAFINVYTDTDQLESFHDPSILTSEAARVPNEPQLSREEATAKMEAILLETLGSFDGYEKTMDTWGVVDDDGLYVGCLQYTRRLGDCLAEEYVDVNITGYGSVWGYSAVDVGVFAGIKSVRIDEEKVKTAIEAEAWSYLAKKSGQTFDPATDRLVCKQVSKGAYYWFENDLYSPDGGELRVPYWVHAAVVRTDPNGNERQIASGNFSYEYSPDVMYK